MTANKRVSCHTSRHFFATHLPENHKLGDVVNLDNLTRDREQVNDHSTNRSSGHAAELIGYA